MNAPQVLIVEDDAALRGALCQTMEFGGYDEKLNRSRLKILTKGAAHYLREVHGEEIEEEWWGWRPMSHNGLPVISAIPQWKNAFIAAGHSMLGLSMGTGTGKLITELMSGQNPHIDAQPYSLKS